MTTGSNQKQPREGTVKRRRRRILAWTLIPLGSLVVLGGVGAGLVYYGMKPTEPNAKPSAMHNAVKSAVQSIGQQVSGITQPTNILLIANNARGATTPLSLGKAAGQADILIVVHIDPQKHVVSLISIPRDTLVAMPGWNVPIPKIKTTFTLGLQESPQKGPEMAMKYVSRMTGLPIHDYIATDFQGFVDAINAVGGIPIDIPARLYDPGHSGANLKPGQQVLNGAQALAFVRVRQNQAGNGYRVNDFQRQQAEMQVLHILKQKVLGSTAHPAEVMKLIGTWQKDVATNLTTPQLLGMAMATDGSKLANVQLGRVGDSMDIAGAPLEGVNAENYLTGAYYDVLDASSVEKTLAPFGSTGASLGLPAFPSPSSVPIGLYGSASTAAELRKAGFPVTILGPSQGSAGSVYYPPGKMPWGWVVARAIGNSNEWVSPASSQSSSVIVYGP